MTVRKDGLETRQRIVEAAARVFADHGFHEATHAAISELAEVNTASINYHFGSKADLYVETWIYLEQQADLIHPMDGGVSSDASPEERLRGRITALVGRIADRGRMGAIHAIRVKEMANPTGHLDEQMGAMHKRHQHVTTNILRDLLGEGVTDLELCLCERSILGQCFIMKSPHRGSDLDSPACNSEELAEHVFNFSISGLREVRDRVQERKAGSEVVDDSEKT
jgi:TetR/AcrR family transcriptional regulator, regulator of cefoperazone and chloramphenicol sensitivity